MNSGDLINTIPITGSFPTASFQNYRFNPSDSIIYGMVPNNFYSSYFDSISMTTIDVLDSSQIRFASLNPQTGVYTLIGNTSFDNLYTLAGNSIDPFQMVYYYSAVDTLIGIDVYSGSLFSAVPIQLPPNGIFENIAYSCADTSIYGLTRQNYTSVVYDSLFMMNVEVIDSTTFRLSKIDPNTGAITFVSPYNIQAGGNLTGGAYIDPNAMTYFFNNGNQIVGVSLITGLITSTATKSYPSGEIAIDMMRSNLNCFGASKTRLDTALGIEGINGPAHVQLFPNPTSSTLSILANAAIKETAIVDIMGKEMFRSSQNSMDVSTLPSGFYIVNVYTETGRLISGKLIKQ
ncbi:MAG: T9SS type A sorting domain-containing protein [Bacteroidetes bacterium]|nr:T9SS type A sorting domain-containing protein [Bacteroidota bacterium]